VRNSVPVTDVKSTCSQRHNNSVDEDNTLVSLTQVTYHPCPPWIRLVTPYQASTASVEAHQTKRWSLTNGTGFRHPIPSGNFCLRTLVAPYTATQHTLSQHNDSKTKRLNGAYIIPSFALTLYQARLNNGHEQNT
jgi:hypothetical protein